MPPTQLDAQLADLELDAAPPLPKQPPLQEAAATGADTQACACAEGLLNGTSMGRCALRRWLVYIQRSASVLMWHCNMQGAEVAPDAAPLIVIREVMPPEKLVEAILAQSAAMAAA
jgi:hypothetical protein